MEFSTIYEVVKKFVGTVYPIGDSTVDEQIFENLKLQCRIVEELLAEIQDVKQYEENYQRSMKKCGDYAKKFLNSTFQSIGRNRLGQDQI